MAPLLEQDYLIALREFATYFTSKNISIQTVRQLSTLTQLNNAKNYILNNYSHQTEFKLENFLTLTHWFYKKALDYDIINSKLQLDKENSSIIQFLNRIVNSNFMVNENKFSIDQLRDLKIVHSDIHSCFSNSGNNYLENLFNEYNAQIHSSSQQNLNNNQSSNDRNYSRFLSSTPEAQKLIFNVNKSVRYTNHESIFDIHISKGTTPSSIFFNRFPKPHFDKDEFFVEKHNEIIENTQKAIIDLIKHSLKSKIESLTTEINTFKNGINDSNINPNDLVDFIFKKEEEALKTKFIAMKNKAERCEVRKFVVNTRSNDKNQHSDRRMNSTANNSINNENDSLNYSNVSNESVNNSSVSWGRNRNYYYDNSDNNRSRSNIRSRSRTPSNRSHFSPRLNRNYNSYNNNSSNDRCNNARSNNARSNNYRDNNDRSNNDRSNNDRSNNDRSNNDRSNNDRSNNDRSNNDLSNCNRSNNNNSNNDRSINDRSNNDRSNNDRSNNDRSNNHHSNYHHSRRNNINTINSRYNLQSSIGRH
jgi:hypothetical protein